MNFLNRRMFQEGGGAASLGPYQIRDKLTGEIIIDLSDQPNFINQVGFNPYKILNDDTLEKGSAVLSILQQFQKRDAPQIGPFQAQEDLGTNLVDLGFSALRGTEPFIRGGSRLLGETFGIQPLKEFGGKQEFDPSVGLGGIDLFKPTYDSYVPTDQERSRGMIGLLKQSKNLQNKVQNVASNPNVRSGTNMFFDALRSGDEKMSDYFGTNRIFEDRPEQQIQDFQSEIDGFVGPTRPGADVADTAIVTEVSGSTPITRSETLSIEGGPGSLESRRLAYEQEMIGRDEFGDLLPEGRLEKDDEIANLLEEIKPIEQKVDVDKTEADTLADNEAKFGGLSQDEFRATIDDAATPKLLEIERPITDTTIVEEETLRKQNDPVSRKLDQPGFFGSDRFLNFIRNVGGELVRTGQFGEGLASGAAKASEERAARELMADKEERDYRMKLRLAKAEADLEARNKLAEGMKPSDIKTFTEFEDDIAGSLSQFDESERIVSDINQILNEDIKAPGAFGARGFITQISDKFRNLAGYGEEDWNKLAPAVRTQVILDVTAQRSVRQILGESGKTISNLDRDIVARIFGTVGVFTSPAELSKLLTNSRDNIVESMRKDQSLIISRANAIGLGGYNSPALMANESLINRILGFSFDNIQNYKLSDDAAGYIEATL
jgi:hypothetical protein